MDPHTTNTDSTRATTTPEVHPVLVVVIGSTMAELALVLDAQYSGCQDLVPYRVLVIDTTPYEDLRTRLLANGYSAEQVEQAIPRSTYFELRSAFTPGFDFNHPLNEWWRRSAIHDAALERIATQPQVPGCAGTPAMGRARVEGSEIELREYIERHHQELMQVRVETLGLLEGVRVFIVTTFRGGTGTGATLASAAVMRSAMGPSDEIHLRVAMPDIYRGDDRAKANAFAQIREIVAAHCYDAGVLFRADRKLPAPFNTVSPVFVSDGAVALGPADALMQEAAILGGQLRARTQSTYNARHVDLTDVLAHDINDEPTHVRTQTATTVRTVAPGALPGLTAMALRHGMSDMVAAIDEWEKTGVVSATDATRLDQALAAVIKDLDLNLAALTVSIESSPAPGGQLRTFFEQISMVIGNMPADEVKAQMGNLPELVRRKFDTFSAERQDRAVKVAGDLPERLIEALLSRLGDAPHLLLAALPALQDHLCKVAAEAEKKAEAARQARSSYGQAFGQGLQDTQQAGGFLSSFIGRGEVVCDTARKACETGLLASLARNEQERHEALAQVLNGSLAVRDTQGRPVPVPSVAEALRTVRVKALGTLRTRLDLLQSSLQGRVDHWVQLIEKRSAVFQRSLVFDGYTPTRLDADARTLTATMLAAPEGAALVRRVLDLRQPYRIDRSELDDVVGALVKLVPNYGETTRTLAEILQANPNAREIVIKLLRNRTRPFAPTDREAEDQQGLRNRRDNMLIIEVPGGPEGYIGQLVLREGLVANSNALVDAGEDEIRLHYVRDGLPWAVLRPLADFRKRHDRYMQNPAAVHPYTRAGWGFLPTLEPSRTNLRHAVESLLAVIKAALPQHIRVVPSGGYELHYERSTGQNGFTVSTSERFPTMEALVHWVARRVDVRKQLDKLRRDALDADPNAFKQALLHAWKNAAGSERLHLEEALYVLHVNPASAPMPNNTNTSTVPGGTP